MSQYSIRKFRLPALMAATMLSGALPLAASAEGDEGIVATRVDEAPVAKAATRVTDVKVRTTGGRTRIDVAGDGGFGRVELTELASPPRLALDLMGVSKGPRTPREVNDARVRAVRFGAHGDHLRLVIDGATADALPKYELERTPTGLRVWVGTAAEAAPAAVAEAPAKLEGKKVASATPAVSDVRVAGTADAQVVEIALSRLAGYELSRPEPGLVALTLAPGVTLPAELRRKIDAAEFEGPVGSVSTFEDPSTGRVRVVVALAGEATDKVVVDGTRLKWTFRAEEGVGEIVDESGNVMRTASAVTSAPGYALSSVAGKSKYKGRRVSFEFKDIDLHNLLRVIAEVSKRNIILSDDVKGRITIRLRNVPWDQALDLILKTKGLGKEESGNIIRIAPLKQLEEEASLRRKAKEEMDASSPQKVRIIPVNYARAKDLEGKVKDLLTPKRGTVAVDARTNTLIVKDAVEVLSKAEGLVRSLDTQTPQVLIASRFVEAASNFTSEVGIQWGGSLSATAATANSTGLVFPSEMAATGGLGPFAAVGVPAQPNWAVSFPASVASGEGTALGMHFGSAGGAALLNLRLSALEKMGTIKTVSAPRVQTIDNNEAVITTGVSLPFSQTSATGVNTVFIEARLELKVTPHVTADGSILMKVFIKNNQPNPQITGANGQPGITRREAETEMLVADGDTAVIGGVNVRRTAEGTAQTPLFGDIPIVGWLFKNKSTAEERSELLIFISPTVVNRDASLVAGG